jgi:hypothetical protein
VITSVFSTGVRSSIVSVIEFLPCLRDSR